VCVISSLLLQTKQIRKLSIILEFVVEELKVSLTKFQIESYSSENMTGHGGIAKRQSKIICDNWEWNAL
jgi:hypothetical protein